MSILAILYWVILVLAIVGAFVPANTTWWHPFIGGLPYFVLFILIGLKIFRTPIQ